MHDQLFVLYKKGTNSYKNKIIGDSDMKIPNPCFILWGRSVLNIRIYTPTNKKANQQNHKNQKTLPQATKFKE